jgi:hypothetical protein
LKTPLDHKTLLIELLEKSFNDFPKGLALLQILAEWQLESIDLSEDDLLLADPWGEVEDDILAEESSFGEWEDMWILIFTHCLNHKLFSLAILTIFECSQACMLSIQVLTNS